MNNGLKGSQWKITNSPTLIIAGVLQKPDISNFWQFIFFLLQLTADIIFHVQRRFHNVGAGPNDWWAKSTFFFFFHEKVNFLEKEGFYTTLMTCSHWEESNIAVILSSTRWKDNICWLHLPNRSQLEKSRKQHRSEHENEKWQWADKNKFTQQFKM